MTKHAPAAAPSRHPPLRAVMCLTCPAPRKARAAASPHATSMSPLLPPALGPPSPTHTHTARPPAGSSVPLRGAPSARRRLSVTCAPQPCAQQLYRLAHLPTHTPRACHSGTATTMPRPRQNSRAGGRIARASHSCPPHSPCPAILERTPGTGPYQPPARRALFSSRPAAGQPAGPPQSFCTARPGRTPPICTSTPRRDARASAERACASATAARRCHSLSSPHLAPAALSAPLTPAIPR